jgi:hypothetical protein
MNEKSVELGMYSLEDYQYGPVVVARGRFKGRVGELDDIEGRRGYVYFAGFGITSRCELLPLSYLRAPNTRDLWDRHSSLWRSVTAYLETPLQGEARIDALQELAYVAGVLSDRMFDAQFMTRHEGLSVFLSHSSADKSFVRGLAVDLAALGHKPWLDEWEISGGESIPTKIAEGIESSDVVLVVLSAASISSKWVENEWQAKHWDEVSSRRVSVIPILLEDCEIPTLLKTKRYLDFRDDYSTALNDLARTLKKFGGASGRGNS